MENFVQWIFKCVIPLLILCSLYSGCVYTMFIVGTLTPANAFQTNKYRARLKNI